MKTADSCAEILLFPRTKSDRSKCDVVEMQFVEEPEAVVVGYPAGPLCSCGGSFIRKSRSTNPSTEASTPSALGFIWIMVPH